MRDAAEACVIVAYYEEQLQLARAERDRRIAALRDNGVSQRHISRELTRVLVEDYALEPHGVSLANVRLAVRRAAG